MNPLLNLAALFVANKKKIAGKDNDWEEGDDYYSKVFTQRLNLWKLNDTVKRYMLNPDLGKMLCGLAGVEGILLKVKD